ncbi:Uncharacterised protein [Pseudomonas fluorescens]|uniref:Uncharacterized protein n=1 Tax=Pseudomonas fluorescens TaxID=294 RepID=A0A3S4Q369_PSEFL|nr:Uncharacterised protein [Pseudomonas fluorescens]
MCPQTNSPLSILCRVNTSGREKGDGRRQRNDFRQNSIEPLGCPNMATSLDTLHNQPVDPGIERPFRFLP